MDKFLTELDEAIERLDNDRQNMGRDEELMFAAEDVIKAATMLRDLYPLLVQLCEARSKAVEEFPWWGEWVSLHNGESFVSISDNLTTQIQKILEGK